jgi:DNA excision repair protein ERCC-4
LLNYDPLAFHTYLETIIASNTQSVAGNPRQNQSPWLLTDAAHIIIETAKKRCYVLREVTEKRTRALTDVIEISDDEDAWEALDEAEGRIPRAPATMGGKGHIKSRPRPAWLPKDIEPILEELPKWHLLSETLKEIEEEIMRQESLSSSASYIKLFNTIGIHISFCIASHGNDVVLVMTSSTQTSSLLSEYLASMDPGAPSGQRGRQMLEKKLRRYLYWKARLSTRSTENQPSSAENRWSATGDDELNPALRKKDRERAERSASRRRVRGGALGTVSVRAQGQDQVSAAPSVEEGILAELYVRCLRCSERPVNASYVSLSTQENVSSDAELALALTLDAYLPPDDAEFESCYGLLVPAQTVIVRAYADDGDDRMLAELQPRFIVMYEPNQDFVRRIEVCF